MKKKRFISTVLVLTMAAALLLGGCGGSGDTTSDSGKKEDKKASGDTIKVGWNNYMEGAYLTTIEGMQAENAYEILGGYEVTSVNDEASLEKATENLKTMISSGCNALQQWTLWDSLAMTVSQECAKAQIPFVMPDCLMVDEDVIDTLQANEYFVGNIGANNYNAGLQMGEYAGDTYKNAIIVGLTEGTLTNDQKVDGFTEGIENKGGKVVDVVRTEGTDTQEVLSMLEDSLIAHPETEVIYCCNGMMASAAMSAADKHSDMNLALMCSDLEVNVIEAVENGTMWAANGGQHMVGLFAAVMMDKYLSGDPFLDEDGKAPVVGAVNYITLTKENADFYRTYWLDGCPYTDDEIKKMAEMDWSEFLEAVENYSMEERMNSLCKQGVVTEEELKDAGIEVTE